MARQRARSPRTAAREEKTAPAGDDAQSPAGAEQSPSSLAWEWYVREYNRRAAELSPYVSKPLNIGAFALGEWFPLPSEAQRTDFFARLVDELAPLAGEGLKGVSLAQRSIDHANAAIEELRRVDDALRRQQGGLALGPAARSKRAAKIAHNGRDAKSLYYKAAFDYALQHPDARRDTIVAFVQRLNLPAAKATTIRRYIAGAIESARTRRAQSQK